MWVYFGTSACSLAPVYRLWWDGQCSGGRRCVTSKNPHTVSKSFRHESETECSTTPPSGTTCVLSTGDHGAVALMSSQPDSHARDLASPASNSPAPILETGGLTPLESFARLDLDTSSWRTSQGSFLDPMDISDRFSKTWPSSGTMRHEACYPRPTLEPPTSESDSGSSPLYPTPTASQYGSSNNGQRSDGTTFKQAGKPSLESMARHPATWPTPQARDHKGVPRQMALTHNARPLNEAVAVAEATRWPTPTAGDSKASGSRNLKGSKAHKGTSLTDAIVRGGSDKPTGGHTTLATKKANGLNPSWVEWLMGWPIGWTDCEPLEMDGYRWWLRSHGVSLAEQPETSEE